MREAEVRDRERFKDAMLLTAKKWRKGPRNSDTKVPLWPRSIPSPPLTPDIRPLGIRGWPSWPSLCRAIMEAYELILANRKDFRKDGQG